MTSERTYPRGLWQFVDDAWPSCHFWQMRVKRSFLAMMLFVATALLAAYAVVAALVALPKDGYRRVPTDWRRLP